ncbi:hypothetical protein CCP3SC1AL1_10002 [Gammaproteobacteria bacterium]
MLKWSRAVASGVSAGTGACHVGSKRVA